MSLYFLIFNFNKKAIDERKEKELKLLENKILIELNKEKQYRKENDAYMMKQIDEKIYNLRLELTKEKKVREEDEDRIALQLNQQYNSLKEEIENEKKRR